MTWKPRNPPTSAIIAVMNGVPVVVLSRAISGRRSNATTAMITPALNPSTRCSRLRFRSANSPPSDVETNVANARRSAINSARRRAESRHSGSGGSARLFLPDPFLRCGVTLRPDARGEHAPCTLGVDEAVTSRCPAATGEREKHP